MKKLTTSEVKEQLDTKLSSWKLESDQLVREFNLKILLKLLGL